MQKKLVVPLVAFVFLSVIALPTALFYGLADLLFGESGSSALFTVVFTVVGLAVLWSSQHLWETWRDSRRDKQG